MSKTKWKIEHQQQINASERERKGRLAANIEKLKDIIPLESIKMQTKEAVLEESLKYIRELKAKVEEMLVKDAPDNYEIERLRKKVNELETEKKYYLRILQSHGLLHKSQITVVPISKIQNSVSQTHSRKDSTVATAKTSIADNQHNPQSCKSSSVSPGKETSMSSPSLNSTNTVTSAPATTTPPCVEQALTNISSSSTSAESSVIDTSDDHSVVNSSISLPQFDLMFRHPNTAFCSPTYSMARIKPNSRSEAPTLCTMLTKSTFQEDKVVHSPSTTNKTKSSVSLSFSTASVTASTATVGSSMKNFISPANQATNVSESSDSLRSWLRSCDSEAMNNSSASAVVVTTAHFTSNAQILPQNFKQSKTSECVKNTNSTATINGKKETHSFNIASLMKSKESVPVNPLSVCTTETPNMHVHPSKNQQVSIVDNGDYNAPRDVFHQSFDNDILECLQNIHTLDTPDPPGKSSIASTGSVTPAISEWVNHGNLASTGKAISNMHPRTPLHSVPVDPNSSLSNSITVASTVGDDVRYSLRYTQQTHCDSFGTGQFESRLLSETASKTRPAHKSSFSGNSHPPISYFNYITATTSALWQPAITAINTCPRHNVASLPAPGCFSPISYFTNGNFNISQSCSAISSSPVWMTSSCQNSYQSVSSRALSDNQSASNSNFEHPKKRKLHQQAAILKRKKLNKPVQEHEDTHSISRLIGFQNPTISPHLPICEQSQRYMNRVPNMSYENDRNSTNRSQIFVNTTGPPGIAPSGVDYGNYPPQPNLFHSAPAITPQRPPYHHPPSGYFYNHPVVPHSQQPPCSMYMPGFANINNNNNSTAVKHHIRQILS